MANTAVLSEPEVKLSQQLSEDPLAIFAKRIGRAIYDREQVSIPVEFRGIDPSTGRLRSTYAAKKDLRHLTQRMFGDETKPHVY